MKRVALLAAILCGVAYAQPAPMPILQQCSATVTTNCTPQVNASGQYTPPAGISACAATPPTSASANLACIGTNGSLYVCGPTTCTSSGQFVVSPGTLGVTGAVPPSLRWLGDGSDGAINCSGNISGVEYATTFTVGLGNTCTSNVTDIPTAIYATGACTIAGTMNARGVDGGANTSAGGDYGGSGGGGGGGATAGNQGGSSGQLPLAYVNNPGGLGGSIGGNGAAGTTLTANTQREAFTAGAKGLFIGGARGSAGGSSGGAGGSAGQGVVMICASINFTGTVDVSGANGANSPGNSIGAGGGGGGGYVWLIGRDSAVNSGTITVAGGAGGSCLAFTGCGAGGAGGAGWSKIAVMP